MSSHSMAPRAYFSYRRADYVVVGYLGLGEDCDMIVRRQDGRAIRGAVLRPGMIQVGISRGLTIAAYRALDAAQIAAEAQS